MGFAFLRQKVNCPRHSLSEAASLPRLARIVVPGISHHVTQRGNRRERVFFSPDDYRFYGRLLAESTRRAGTEIWAYCLMPNQVHLILAPSDEKGLRGTVAEAHRQYTSARPTS